jgi:hypothetical protein
MKRREQKLSPLWYRVVIFTRYHHLVPKVREFIPACWLLIGTGW